MFDYSIIDEHHLDLAKERLETENRFFPDQCFVKAVNELLKDSPSLIKTIGKDDILYRARIYRLKDDKLKNKPPEFEGYGPADSGINPSEWPKEGRMNPVGIKMIYLATGIYTCMKEIGAARGEIVSVASYKPLEEIKVADFQSISARDENKKRLIEWIKHLLSYGYGGRDYVVTQYISMLCKNHGLDGIVFLSKYANEGDIQGGRNIALFSDKKIQCVSSKKYKVNSIRLDYDVLLPAAK